MTIWIPKGVFSPFNEDYKEWMDSWTGNILAFRTELRHEGVKHLENLYRYMYYYLIEEGWVSDKDGSKDLEIYYLESRGADGSKSSVRAWWRTVYGPAYGTGGIAGTHPFLRYRLNVDFNILKAKPKEVTFQGKTIKAYTGDMMLWITAILELDIHEWFEGGSGLMEMVQEFFVRRIYKRNIREHELELRRLASRFADDVKQFIGMNTYDVNAKMMHPEHGMY